MHLLFLCFLLTGFHATGQKADTSEKIKIHILNNKFVTFTHTDTGDFYRFVGDVIMQQGTDTLYCDTLLENKSNNIIEAFGNVRIAQQDGTQGASDYLKYTSDKKLAYMHGNVSLTDGKNNLKSEDLTYDLAAKVGNYYNGGTLHNDSTTVTSNEGVYNGRTKDTRFKGHAIIIDPQYKIHSEDLEYNTETKLTRFYAKSTVTSDSGKSILQTKNGTYDGKKGIAHFLGHSTIWNDGEYIEGDSLDYNKLTGYGLGNGNVICIDTAHHSTLYCGHTEYFHKNRVLWATIKPVMEQVNGKDTFYLRGDTMYSAPMVKVKIAKPKKPANITDSTSLLISDSKNDSTAKWVDAKTSVINRQKDLKEDTGKSGIAKMKILADTPTITKQRLGPEPDLNDTVKVKDSPKGKGVSAGKDIVGKPTMGEAFAGKTKYPGDTSKPGGNSKIKGSYAGKDSTNKIRMKPHPDFTWEVPTGPKFRKLDTMHGKAVSTVPKPVTKKKNKMGAGIEGTTITMTDTTSADTTAPMYFIAWNHVLLFSDSMQGKCDSICYTRSDSTIRMITAPIAWAHNSQITGDTILLHLDSSELKSMYVPNNALIVSQSGPAKAQLYDQVQGRTLTAFFKNNAITQMLVFPEAECIYYSKDELDAYLGVDEGKSEKMLIFFEDQKIINIKFLKDVHQTVTPMEKADIPNTKLSRFKWLIDQRPKSKEELFR